MGPTDTPAEHAGYVRCARCGTVVPPSAVVKLGLEDVCADTKWCSQQAGVGRGTLELEPTKGKGP